MMNKLLTGAAVVCGLVVATGCSDSFDPSGDRQGRIMLTVDVNTEVLAPKSRAVADNGEIGIDDLSVRLTAIDGSFAGTWAIGEFPTNRDYLVGDYLLEAFYGTADEEGFAKPYYYGSQSLTVLENKTTPVSLTASLANSMVSIRYSEAVKQFFTSYSAAVVSASGQSHDYAADETRPLFVRPGTVEINVNVTKQNGVAGSLSTYSFTAEPRHHYTVTFDVNGGGVGTAETLTVTFNSDLVEETVEVDLSDEILASPAPEIAVAGFASGDAIDVIEGTTPANPLKLTFKAQAGLKGVVMTTSSAYLVNQLGWPAEIDLATADEATLASLKAMGLTYAGFGGQMSQMALVDLTNVIKNIQVVAGADNATSFAFVAKDTYKMSDPVTLTVNVEKLTLEISDIEAPLAEQTEMSFILTTNAPDPAEIKFQRRNAQGQWEEMPVVAINPVSRASSSYRVTVTVPADGTIDFRAVSGDAVAVSAIHSVAHVEPDQVLACNANDVFAKSATLSMSSISGADAAAMLADSQISISTDGNSYSVVNPALSGANFTLTGLTPATTYYVRAKYNEIFSRKLTFTTEAAAQIPDGDMETWGTAGSGSNWTNYYLGSSEAAAVWGTNNPMTTSQGANAAYCRATQTRPTTDAHSGTNAAWIRTMGWGSGNTAAGNISVMKYGDAGLLHLGASRTARPSGYSSTAGALTTDDLDCGLPFSSRPASLSFWYKYSPKNGSDLGEVQFVVYDVAGAVLFTETRTLASASSYTQVTIPVTYAAGAKKAGSIYVRFLSTNNADYLTKDKSNFNMPSISSSAEFLGSQLYIDDVTLNY